MRKILTRFLLSGQLLLACGIAVPAYAGTYNGLTIEVSCAASGSSTQVFDAITRRGQWAIINESGIDVRIGMIRAALGTPALTPANSILLKTGKALTDSGDTVYIGRIVCASTTAGTASVGKIESFR